jgi:hypothetical protein
MEKNLFIYDNKPKVSSVQNSWNYMKDWWSHQKYNKKLDDAADDGDDVRQCDSYVLLSTIFVTD